MDLFIQRWQNTVGDEELVEPAVLRQFWVESGEEVPPLAKGDDSPWVCGVCVVFVDGSDGCWEEKSRYARDDLDRRIGQRRHQFCHDLHQSASGVGMKDEVTGHVQVRG